MVINKADSNEPVSRFWSKLNLLSDVINIMSGNPPVKETLLKVMERINEVIPFTSAIVYFLDINEVKYKKEIAIGPEFEPAELLKTNSSERFSAWAIGIQNPLILSNEGLNNRLAGSGIGSLLAVPLRIENRPIGLICITHSETEYFRDHDVKLFSMLAHQIAISRERSIYRLELEDRNRELEKAQKMLELTKERLINDERLMAVRELSVSINHEINNPLSVIVGNIQCLLFIEKNLNEKVKERLKRVEAEAMKIADINHRLLEIDELVSETYINDGQKIKMINIEKSSSGMKNA
ncbi:MAG: hypothetical protein DRP51_03675 [Candidatus Zixiibacteriota bacterium]|nr:MAG: hypothetical protein DRP51_03675 [candidate division Zixibacteria bacterium]